MYPKFEKKEFIIGENIISKRNAILPVKCADYGIKPLSEKYNEHSEKGEQGIVGTLFLTNYRLFFKSVNKFTRLDGRMSIFLPSIQEVKNISFASHRKIKIVTKLATCKFDIWNTGWIRIGIAREKKFIKQILEQKSKWDEGYNTGIFNFLSKNQELAYKAFTINKITNNFWSFAAIFSPPKGQFTFHSFIQNETSQINKECIGLQFLKQYYIDSQDYKTMQNKS